MMRIAMMVTSAFNGSSARPSSGLVASRMDAYATRRVGTLRPLE